MSRRFWIRILGVAMAAAGGCSSPPLLSTGQQAYEAGDYDQAISVSTLVLDRDSHSYGAYLLRGKSFERKGEYAKAITDYDQARRQDGTQGEPVFRETQCQVTAGHPADAEATIAGALKEGYGAYSVRDQMLSHAVHAEVQLAVGDFPRASQSLGEAIKVAHLSRALDADQTTAIIYYNLSRVQFEQGAYRRAREAYQEYLSRQGSGGAAPEGHDLYTMAVLHFLCEDIASSRKISASLPAEDKARLEAILAGDTFSVRALYEQKQKQAQESNP